MGREGAVGWGGTPASLAAPAGCQGYEPWTRETSSSPWQKPVIPAHTMSPDSKAVTPLAYAGLSPPGEGLSPGLHFDYLSSNQCRIGSRSRTPKPLTRLGSLRRVSSPLGRTACGAGGNRTHVPGGALWPYSRSNPSRPLEDMPRGHRSGATRTTSASKPSVGLAGLEPAISWSQTTRLTMLGYRPKCWSWWDIGGYLTHHLNLCAEATLRDRFLTEPACHCSRGRIRTGDLGLMRPPSFLLLHPAISPERRVGSILGLGEPRRFSRRSGVRQGEHGWSQSTTTLHARPHAATHPQPTFMLYSNPDPTGFSIPPPEPGNPGIQRETTSSSD